MTVTLQARKFLALKNSINKIIEESKSSSLKNQHDPLFEGAPKLSKLVSEVDGIKKRHTKIISYCLIEGIRGLDKWEIERIPDKYMNSKEVMISWNKIDGQIYVFEAKRGHGEYDLSSVKSLNERLHCAKNCLSDIATQRQISNPKSFIFVISYYGKSWSLEYPVVQVHSLGGFFGQSLQRLMEDFLEFNESEIRRIYSEKIPDESSQIRFNFDRPNLFQEIKSSEINENSTILINKNDFKVSN